MPKFIKKTCDKCGKAYRQLWALKDKMVCWRCHKKGIKPFGQLGRNRGWKKNTCIRCGEPCHKQLCRECFEQHKHRGQLARLSSLK
jgi:hypothetical protein